MVPEEVPEKYIVKIARKPGHGALRNIEGRSERKDFFEANYAPDFRELLTSLDIPFLNEYERMVSLTLGMRLTVDQYRGLIDSPFIEDAYRDSRTALDEVLS